MALSIGTFLVSYFYARYIGRKIAETAVFYILDNLPSDLMWIDSQRDQGTISDLMADNDKNNIIKYSQQLSSLDSLCVVVFWSYISVAISFLILLSLNFFYPVDIELEYFLLTEALLLGIISYWLDHNRNMILTDSNLYMTDLRRTYEIMSRFK